MLEGSVMWVIGQPNGCTWLFELFLCAPTSFAILIIDAWVFCHILSILCSVSFWHITEEDHACSALWQSAVPKLFNIQSQSTLDIHKCYARLRLYTVVCRLYTSNHKISHNLYNTIQHDTHKYTICTTQYLDKQHWRTAYRPAFGSSSCIPPPEPAKPVICRPSDFVALIATSCHCCNLPISTIIPYPYLYYI